MPGTPLAEAFVRVRADTSSFKDDVRRGLKDATNDTDGRVFDRMLPSLGKLTSGFSSATTAAVGMLATLGKWATIGAALSTLAAGAASATAYTVGLAAAIAPVGGLLAGLPGLLMTGVAALGVWKLATYGVGSAMAAVWSGDAKALEEALAKLTPAAAAFVTEFQNTVPALKSFQEAAATGFFSELNGSLAHFTDLLKGTQPWIAGLATNLGSLVRTFLEWATGFQAIGQFNTILSNTSILVTAVRNALQPLLTGFLDLATVGSNWLASFAPALQDVLTKFGEWMSIISVDGNALAWLNDAVVVLKQLGGIVKDVWQIFSGLFEAARTAGTGALGVLGSLLDGMNKWVNSAKGQDVLVTIFKALQDVGQALIPVVVALGNGIATIAPEVAKIAIAMGPVLTGAVNALAPALARLGPGILSVVAGLGDAVGKLNLNQLADQISRLLTTAAPLIPIVAQIAQSLAGLLLTALQAMTPGLIAVGGALRVALANPAITTAIKQLGTSFANVLVSLAPLLPVIGKLAALIATSLAAGVQAVMPSIRLLVNAFSDALRALAPVIPLLVNLAATVINALVPALAPLLPQIAALITQLVQGLVPAITPLIPIIAEIAGIIAKDFVTVLGLLVKAVLPLLPPLSELAQTIGQALIKFLQEVSPLLPSLVGAFLDLLPALLPILPVIGELVVALLPVMAEYVKALAPIVIELAKAALQLLDAFMPLMPTLVELIQLWAPIQLAFAQFVGSLLQNVIPAIQWLATVAAEKITEIVNAFQTGVAWIKDHVAWFGTLPDLIGGWLSSTRDKVVEIWNNITSAVSNAVGNIKTAIGDAVSAVQNAWTDAWNAVSNFLSTTWNNITGAVRDAIGNVRTTISNAMSDVQNAWNNAWNNVTSFVGNAWNNIRNGAVDGINAVLQVVRGIPGQVVNALGNLGNLLYDSGRAILGGLINGLWSMFDGVWNTAVDILGRIRSLFPFSPAKKGPFSGKGWTLYSGMSLAEGFADGMSRSSGAVGSAADGLMAAAADRMGGAVAPFATVPGVSSGSFATAAPGGATTVAGGGVTIENLIVQGVLDPSNPATFRRMVEQIREEIRGLEREVYA